MLFNMLDDGYNDDLSAAIDYGTEKYKPPQKREPDIELKRVQLLRYVQFNDIITELLDHATEDPADVLEYIILDCEYKRHHQQQVRNQEYFIIKGKVANELRECLMIHRRERTGVLCY